MLCFRKYLVAKKFVDKMEGEVSRFPWKMFSLTVPIYAVGEPFSLSLVAGIEKVWMRGWAGCGISRFSVENFLSHSAEKFCVVPFCAVFQKLSGSQKVYG